MKLSEEQQEFIDKNHDTTPDLIELTRRVFNDADLDGRTKEGRAVREYLSQKGISYKTVNSPRGKKIDFTPEQKDFIVQYANEGMNSFQIAQIIFPDRVVKNLSSEQRAVVSFLKEYAPGSVRLEDSAIDENYNPPTSVEELMKKINYFSGSKLVQEKLTALEKKCIEYMGIFLRSPRFVMIINGFTDERDRNLFEAEFIRATWDKPDLTSDEVNLYINVCVDYINLKNIRNHIEKLNRMFNEAEEQQDMSIRLAELLKTKSEEYNQCEKRMESLIQRLNGDRAKRVANRREENASILSLVQAFQNEEERKRMVDMAEKQKSLIKDEADKLESMPSWKARILGISKDEAI
jgi:hypothetical protein